MARVHVVSRLNSDVGLGVRLADALVDAVQLDAAVAYVKSTGVELLRAAGLPRQSRFVIGTGFGLTDPHAVDALAATDGISVRIVIGSVELGASAFHPKLYLVRRDLQLVVFSGSANLTRGGLQRNVEQYEELRVPLDSSEATEQLQRFESLWSLGFALSDLRESGAWDAYTASALAKRDRDRREAAEERRAARQMRAMVRKQAGGSLATARGDPVATSERVHSLLERATGIPTERSGRAHVRLDHAIGTRSIQRAGLEPVGGQLTLLVWPAELQGQAREFYPTGRASALLAFLDAEERWTATPRPHLAFFTSTRDQRLYMTPRLELDEYVRSWSGEDLDWVRRYQPSAVEAELWPWLLERGYASPSDTAELPRFKRSLAGRGADLRPGIRVSCESPPVAFDFLDGDEALVSDIRAGLVALLAALDEPQLPVLSRASAPQRLRTVDDLRRWIRAPVVRSWVDEFPDWVTRTFSEDGWVRYDVPNRAFTVGLRGRGRARGWFEREYLFVQLYHPEDPDIKWLRSRLSRPDEVRLNESGKLRFKIFDTRDLDHAKEFFRRVFQRTTG